mmetsp:Transcript_23208/g.60721  ORF Transcript_23208/g.60721 Transcript_23208/m.60721 type:complete len:215 (+) Transcript_23208:29-673(+)
MASMVAPLVLALLGMVPAPAHAIVSCTDLFSGQTCCTAVRVDEQTQTAVGCQENRSVATRCYAREGVVCVLPEGDVLASTAVDPTAADDTTELCDGVYYNTSDAIGSKAHPCAYINPDALYNFWVAVSLSVFLGPFGADRFYLGYYGLGLVKLTTGGLLCLGWFVDVVLIALQIVHPADGTDYYMGYYESRFRGLSGPGTQLPDDVTTDYSCPS